MNFPVTVHIPTLDLKGSRLVIEAYENGSGFKLTRGTSRNVIATSADRDTLRDWALMVGAKSVEVFE